MAERAATDAQPTSVTVVARQAIRGGIVTTASARADAGDGSYSDQPSSGVRSGTVELETSSTKHRDHVAVVTLNRPERRNALNEVMQRELRDVWQSIKVDDDVRAVVLTAAGTDAFCTGIDRGEIPVTEEQFFFDPYTYDDPGKFIGPRSQELWKPVIAAVNGMACGGAFYLLGESDIIIAAETRHLLRPARHLRDAGGVRAGADAAGMPFGDLMRMTLTGTARSGSAASAQRIGLVSEVVPADELLDTASTLAEAIARTARGGAGLAAHGVGRPRPHAPADAVPRQHVPDQGHDGREHGSRAKRSSRRGSASQAAHPLSTHPRRGRTAPVDAPQGDRRRADHHAVAHGAREHALVGAVDAVRADELDLRRRCRARRRSRASPGSPAMLADVRPGEADLACR